MRVVEAARKAPVTIRSDDTLARAAQLMDQFAVGALVVTNGDSSLGGIVTDRDITVRGVARNARPDSRIDSVMTTDVISLSADADVREAIQIFRSHAFRRIPIVDGDSVAGMITVDDLAVDLVSDLHDLIRPVAGEVIFGHREPSVPAVR